MSHPSKLLGAITLAALGTLALSACGANDGDRADAAELPDACAAAFPLQPAAADLADVTLRPADFPAPPVDGTLCRTSSTLDDSITTAEYATDATASQVLDAYETQLGSRYDVVRADDGAGETLTGDLGGGVFVQVTPRSGAYSVAFGTE